MDRDEVWRNIHAERAALVEQLRDLSAEDLAHPSLCSGWSTKDVAAHVISSPQLTWGQMPGILARGRFSFNRMILVDGQRRGRAPMEEILTAFETYAGSTHHPPVTTHLEPLIDILVHSQDILRPLGRRHEMPPAAAVAAIERCYVLAPAMGTRKTLKSVQLVATDIDWQRGSGPRVEAPAQELLMVCTGRAAHAQGLSGDGVELL